MNKLSIKRLAVIIIIVSVLIIVAIISVKSKNEKVQNLEVYELNESQSTATNSIEQENILNSTIEEEIESESSTEENVEYTEILTDPSNPNLESLYIDLDNIPLANIEIDEKYYVILSERLSLLPQKILDEMYAQDWGFIITTQDLANTYFPGKYQRVHAVTSFNQKLILIEMKEDSLTIAPLHEVGHYVDFANNRTSRTNEFIKIYQIERNQFKSSCASTAHARSNSVEYFAECFQEYIMYPSNLQRMCPLTYGYIEAIVNKYK